MASAEESGVPVETFEAFIIKVEKNPKDPDPKTATYYVTHEIETFAPGGDFHEAIATLFANGYDKVALQATPVRKKKSAKTRMIGDGVITANIDFSDG
jgi:hypothetical protein